MNNIISVISIDIIIINTIVIVIILETNFKVISTIAFQVNIVSDADCEAQTSNSVKNIIRDQKLKSESKLFKSKLQIKPVKMHLLAPIPVSGSVSLRFGR